MGCGDGPDVLGRLLAQIDPKLADLVSAWPTLPEPIKAGVLAMVKAAT